MRIKISRFLKIGLLLVGLAIYAACRKIDYQPQKEKSKASLEEKFFNNHRSSDPHVIALNSFLKRHNTAFPFVESTIERVGYPYWDKAQISIGSAASGRGMSDSVLFTYIPFSFDIENVVSASLIVRTSERDTAIKWICDWQYYDLPNSTLNVSGSAEEMALFFMQLQKITFGDTLFTITDSTLFANPSFPTPMSGLRRAIIKTNETGDRFGKQVNQVWECTDIFYCGTPWWEGCNDANGCDYDEGCAGVGSEHCFLVTADCTCLFGCGGGGGGEPFGSGEEGWNQGGGGGSPGEGAPPNCTPIAVRGTSANPNCLPGWQPVPPPGNNPPPEPIDSILSKYSRKFRPKGDSIYNNHSLPGNKEYFFAGAKNFTTGDTAILNIRTDNDSTSVTPILLVPYHFLIFIWHSHVSASSNPADRRSFSPMDINYLRNLSCLKLNFASFADCGNKQYALVITDLAKAQAFFAANNRRQIEDNFWTTGGGNMQEVDERCVENVIGSAAVNGISFYVSTNSPNFSSWTLFNP